MEYFNNKHREDQRKEKDKEKKEDVFVPYATMFKLQEGVCLDTPRQLECVNCEIILEWRIYTISTGMFDKRCPECKVKACDFWKGKLRRELKNV